ncbi:uncharacterized protein FOMMEDRAFT_161749 [Fomitiporia mediterranea MF3/22]|uniref:uncharacterized protein n=1 Tax=Fomitiporia mediterranea (strain MF3/22) TaxID=694068 RepID=UPI00044072AD|nr:uncharacterized protein FOMMEDRAFT_161749 [Fomitiporia mediterranea MF3/22]EJC98383.1 hypothetical protein FOMMEDRAFT_161749 [Fomitiporia mediterranea MF3/22]
MSIYGKQWIYKRGTTTANYRSPLSLTFIEDKRASNPILFIRYVATLDGIYVVKPRLPILHLVSYPLRERLPMNTSNQQLGPIYRLPAELLLQIFSEFDWDGSEPYLTDWRACPWSRYIRMRKTLLLACRTWYEISLPALYHFVYLYRITQLPAFVRTLLERDASDRKISHRVKHLRCAFHLPKAWTTLYYENMKTIVKHCRNVQTLQLRPSWDEEANPYDFTLMRMHDLEDIPFPDLVELIMGREALITATRQEIGISHFQHLTKLHMVISPLICRIGLGVDVTLPNLKSLTCEFTANAAYRAAPIIAENWSLPELQNLSVKLVWSYMTFNTRPSLDPIKSLCQAYGHGLLSLRIDNRSTCLVFRTNLSSILTACPELTYIEYPIDYMPVSKRRLEQSESLRTVAFLPSTLLSHCNFGPRLCTHIGRYEERSAFPVLDAVALLDPQLRGTTIDADTINQEDVRRLLELSRRLVPYRIRLLNHDFQPIQFFHGGGNEEVDMDSNDEDFIPGSTHAESSSSEDELEETYDYSDDSVDENMQIDNEEALEIFEQTMAWSDEDSSD